MGYREQREIDLHRFRNKFKGRRKLSYEIRIWMIKRLFRSATWAVHVREGKYGPIFRLMDVSRHIDHGCFTVQQVLEHEWHIIG